MLRAPQTPSFSAVTRAICLHRVHRLSPILDPELLREGTWSYPSLSPRLRVLDRPQNLADNQSTKEPILTKLE